MLTGGTVKFRLPPCQIVQRQQSLPWGRPAFHILGTSFLRGSVFQGILRQTSVYHKTPLSGFNTQNPGRMQPSTSAFGNEPATTAAGNGPAIRKLSPHGKRTGIPFIAGTHAPIKWEIHLPAASIRIIHPANIPKKIPANLSSRKPIPRKTPPMQANTAIASILKKSDNNINITLILFHYPAIRDGVSCNSRPFPAENGRPTSFQAPASLRFPHWTAPQMRPWNGFPARHSPWHN